VAGAHRAVAGAVLRGVVPRGLAGKAASGQRTVTVTGVPAGGGGVGRAIDRRI